MEGRWDGGERWTDVEMDGVMGGQIDKQERGGAPPS